MNESATTRYVVVGCKPWNKSIFEEVISQFPGQWRYISAREELTVEKLREIAPRYVFFLHWPWMVPAEIIDGFECVCCHMTNVPYGRGGSPLQNLIARGHRKTKLTALRMSEKFDEGPVYMKRDLCLEGNAEEILIRTTYLSAKMIKEIVCEEPEPIAQSGEVVIFKRRQPSDSEIPPLPGLHPLYDHIRMLDADGYPKAFLSHEGFRYEFRRVALYDGRIEASVIITPEKEAENE